MQFFDSFLHCVRRWHKAEDVFSFLGRNEYATFLLSASRLVPSSIHCTVESALGFEMVIQAPCCERSTVLLSNEVEALRLLSVRLPCFPSRHGEVLSVDNFSFPKIGNCTCLTSVGEESQYILRLLERAHHSSCCWKGRQPSRLLLGDESLSMENAGMVRFFCAALLVQSPQDTSQRLSLPRGISSQFLSKQAWSMYQWLFQKSHSLEDGESCVTWKLVSTSRRVQAIATKFTELLQQKHFFMAEALEDVSLHSLCSLIVYLFALHGFDLCLPSSSPFQGTAFPLQCRYCGAALQQSHAESGDSTSPSPAADHSVRVTLTCSWSLGDSPHRVWCPWSNLFLSPVLKSNATEKTYEEIQLTVGMSSDSSSPSVLTGNHLRFLFNGDEIGQLLAAWHTALQLPTSIAEEVAEAPAAQYPLARCVSGLDISKCIESLVGDCSGEVENFLHELTTEGHPLSVRAPALPHKSGLVEQLMETLWAATGVERRQKRIETSVEEKSCLEAGIPLIHGSAEGDGGDWDLFESQWAALETKFSSSEKPSHSRTFFNAAECLSVSLQFVEPFVSTIKPGNKRSRDDNPQQCKAFSDNLKNLVGSLREERMRPPPFSPAPVETMKNASPAPLPPQQSSPLPPPVLSHQAAPRKAVPPLSVQPQNRPSAPTSNAVLSSKTPPSNKQGNIGADVGWRRVPAWKQQQRNPPSTGLGILGPSPHRGGAEGAGAARGRDLPPVLQGPGKGPRPDTEGGRPHGRGQRR